MSHRETGVYFWGYSGIQDGWSLSDYSLEEDRKQRTWNGSCAKGGHAREKFCESPAFMLCLHRLCVRGSLCWHYYLQCSIVFLKLLGCFHLKLLRTYLLSHLKVCDFEENVHTEVLSEQLVMPVFGLNGVESSLKPCFFLLTLAILVYILCLSWMIVDLECDSLVLHLTVRALSEAELTMGAQTELHFFFYKTVTLLLLLVFIFFFSAFFLLSSFVFISPRVFPSFCFFYWPPINKFS